MTMTALDIPQDILIYILILLPLRDISRFRRTCRAAFSLVTGSKRLWSYILKEEIIIKGLRLPLYRSSFEEVDAIQLEAWIQSALTIHRNYKDSAETLVSRMGGLECITWVKLVRGRWCFVACSDTTQSRLLLFDTIHEIDCKAQLYFPGPIMDGQIYDSGSGVDLAFTVGAKVPFIDILRFGIDRDELSIHKLASIPYASCTRLFEGSLVGFAVRFDDDSFPCIFDWRSGRTWILKAEENGFSSENVNISIEERGMCYGVAYWNGLLVVVFGKYLQIFLKPQLDGAEGVLSAISNIPLGLQNAICEVHFHSYPNSLYETDSEGMANDSLYLFVRQNSCLISILELRSKGTLGVSRIFVVLQHGELWDNSNVNTLERLTPYSMAVGSTGSAIAWCGFRTAAKVPFELPHLVINSIDTHTDYTTGSGDCPNITLKFGRNISLPRGGLPMLHQFPCLDFDDGRGILVVGTSKGDLALIRLRGSRCYLKGCLNDDFPLVQKCLGKVSESISVQLVPMDLPAYYTWQYEERKKAGITPESQTYGSVEIESADIPPIVIEELFSRPNQPSIPRLSVEGWSTEWTEFEFLEQWVVPTMRWGCRDHLYEDNAVTYARESTPFLADPIPLCYQKTDGKVLFRVGKRLYMLFYAPDESGSLLAIHRLNLALENLSEHILRVLLRKNDISIKVNRHGSDAGSDLLCEDLFFFDKLIGFYKKHGIYTATSKPDEWSVDRWKHIHQIWDDVSKGKTTWLDGHEFT